jgi:hypothetical protein
MKDKNTPHVMLSPAESVTYHAGKDDWQPHIGHFTFEEI